MNDIFSGYNRPLGRLLQEDYDLTPRQIGARLRWDEEAVDKFIRGEKDVTEEEAGALATLAGTSKQFLLNLQNSFHRLR